MSTSSHGKSKRFLEEVINDFPDDRVSMDEECIKVTGSSGTPYRIRLNGASPYMVFRESERVELIAIDLVSQNPSFPLGDILVALTLVLFHDEEHSDKLPHMGDRSENDD